MHVTFGETEDQFLPVSMCVPWLYEADCVYKFKVTRHLGGVARSQIPAKEKNKEFK